ncbi:hypothetical protein CC86DRAFT_137801 [Ophiobolus disseminans]|uniref:Heterokaryon incompatibility domain-containing protein n=1 Tax=Ophiobolus disseminans TaxID=1469910 RepID=A0A6A7AEL5_9PLEO|nr:hypothetical protein CC86DRAFT_137801 [Ophiobolus disseminans]
MDVPPSSALTKALFKSGLTFRDQDAETESDVIQLQVLSISESISANTNTEGLCSTCQTYGLEYLHLLECPVQLGEHQYDKNSWLRAFDIRSHFEDSCAVCELLVSLLPENSSGPWRICWVGYGRWSMYRDQGWTVKDEFLPWDFLRTPAIVVSPNNKADFKDWWMKRDKHGLVLPTRKAGEDRSLPRARYLDSTSVDFEAAKSWVKTCEDIHDTTCSDVREVIEGLRVIDCRTKGVVAAPKNCNYVALSYFRPTEATTLEDLPDWDSLPALFRDALAATLQLGFDYLWIERYCGLRDEPTYKQGQWRHIDKVFSGAHITIIAACSDDISIGLPGVGEHARQPTPAAIIGESKLVATPSKERDSAWKSKWYNEGFAYDECLLSRRRLLFTDHGLLFQCTGPNDVESYAIESLDIALGAPELGALRNSKIVFSDIRFVHLFPEAVWSFLKMYTKKARPDRPDNLYPLNALLNKFASLSEEFDHVWAMPVYQRPVQMPVAEPIVVTQPPKVRQTYAERLASSLIWEAQDATGRQHDFPTWSWASSTAVIECEDYNIRNLDLDISFEKEAGGKISIDDYFSQPAAQRPTIGTGMYFNGPVIFVELEAPLFQNDWYLPVTSFERKYSSSINLRHALLALKTWDEDMEPGRYLTLILGASQATRTSWLTYHLLVLKEKDGYYERGFVLKIKDVDLNNRIPEETWGGWMEESMEVLGEEKFPWIYADFPADFGLEKDDRDKWEKVFLIAKHLRVQKREVLVR